MESWERQVGESARAFEAAQIYFHMGAQRSLSAVAQQLTKSDTLIKRWSRKFNGVERAACYDRHMGEVEQQKLEEEVQAQAEAKAAEWIERLGKLREAEWKAAQEVLKRVETMLKFPVEAQEVRQDGDKKIVVIMPMKWRASDISRLLLTYSKLGRLATGAETDRPGSIDFSELSEEQLERIAKTGRL